MKKYIYTGTEEQLIESVYSKSHVAVYPTAFVKVVDIEKKYIIEICLEEPSYNDWTGEDWKHSREIRIWECSLINERSKSKILLEPKVGEHLYYERLGWGFVESTPYIQDLIAKGLVKEVEE